MPLGISNNTGINMSDIYNVINLSTGDPSELLVRINTYVYDGYLYIIMLSLLWVILYFNMQKTDDQPINNMMYAGAAVSVIAFFLRAITYTLLDGSIIYMLTDFQMWIFPIFTSIMAGIVWATKSS